MVKSHTTEVLFPSLALFSFLFIVLLAPWGDACAEQAEKESRVMNLKNVDIQAFIEIVSRRTGKNFIIDPRVKANVNVILSDGVSDEKLYDLFLSVLAVHGFAAIPAGNMVKIVPLP